MSGIPPYANPRPLPVAPCCNTGCDLKDRVVLAAERYVSMDANFSELEAAIRAYREWRDRK